MATFDRSFIDGVFWRMIGLGTAVAAVTAWFISLRFGLSLVIGCALGAASLRLTTASVERMFKAVVERQEQGSRWAVLIGLKILALLAAVIVVLACFKADPIAFVIGFKMILPAIAWQAIRNPRFLEDGDDDDANRQESL